MSPEPAKGLDREKLPSKINFYNVFDTGADKVADKCGNGYTGNIENSLNGFPSEGDFHNKMKKALYAASRMQAADTPLYNERYNALYYWIGDQLWNKLQGTSNGAQFMGKMAALCSIMGNDTGGKGCRTICTRNIDHDIFDKRKTIFEYYYDYNTIEDDLLKKDKPNCTPDWLSYRQYASAVCKAVKQNCKEKYENDDYCKKFKADYRVYCDSAELLDTHCKKDLELGLLQAEEQLAKQQVKSTLTKLEEAIHQANKASSLSSAFGTLALMELPALAFFLYKYKPWSSWIGNNSNRRRRVKRSTERSTFDTLTENTSIYDSGTESTIADSADLAENSTVRSGAYNTRQSTMNRTNNSEPVHENNIGYARM